MAEERLSKDAVIQKWSDEWGVDKNAVRNFVERHDIDAVALFEEKCDVMRRKALRQRRRLLGGVTQPPRDFTIKEEVQS